MVKENIGVKGAVLMSALSFLFVVSVTVFDRGTEYSTGMYTAQTIRSSETDTQDTTVVRTYEESTDTTLFVEDFSRTTEEFTEVTRDLTESFTATVEPEEDVRLVDTNYSKECPFSVRTGDVRIDFSDSRTVDTSIRAGTYSIELASFHVPVTTRTVTLNESWHLELFDKERSVVLRSTPIRDMENGEEMVIERVNGEAELLRDVYRARAIVHPDVDLSQEFSPICARLRPIAPTDNTTFETNFERSIDEFVDTRESTIDTFSQENEDSVFSGETVTVTEEGVRETDSNTVVFEEGGVVGSFTNSASGYTSHSTGEVQTGVYVTVGRDDVLERYGDDLFTGLQTMSQRKREQLLSTLATRPLQTDQTDSAEFRFERKVAEQATVLERTESKNPEFAFDEFRFLHRSELGDLTDSDGDGVTDYDEVYLYKTNPFSPFTSGSILTDGERLLLGLDPHKETLETVIVESPKGPEVPIHSRVFYIENIEYETETDGMSDDGITETQRQIRITGRAPALSFVTLYIYSTPIVVTVRADGVGKFEYVLDETLEDGSHELHVASVNNTGKIVSKSEPIAFIKTAEAIEYTPAMVSEFESPVDGAMHTFVTLALFLFLALSIGVVVGIGYVKTKHSSEVHMEEHD